MKPYFIGILLLSISMLCAGQAPVGGRAAGLGGTGVTSQDSWSGFNNIAGAATLEGITAIFGNEARFSLFNTVAAGINASTSIGTFTSTIYRFGDDIFSQSHASLGYSHKIGITSLGTQIVYHQYQMEGLPGAQILLINVGGIIELSPFLYFGAHMANFNVLKNKNRLDKEIPEVLTAGISYYPSSKLMLNMESKKPGFDKLLWSVGMEYEVFKKISFRAGFNIRQRNVFFGLGFKARVLEIDYAVGNHQYLGLSHFTSLTYAIKPGK